MEKAKAKQKIKTSLNCSKCNRKLRVPESKKLGICRSCRKDKTEKKSKPAVVSPVILPEVKMENKEYETKINDYLQSSVGEGKYFSSIDKLLKRLETTKHKTWATIPVPVFIKSLKGLAL